MNSQLISEMYHSSREFKDILYIRKTESFIDALKKWSLTV